MMQVECNNSQTRYWVRVTEVRGDMPPACILIWSRRLNSPHSSSFLILVTPVMHINSRPSIKYYSTHASILLFQSIPRTLTPGSLSTPTQASRISTLTFQIPNNPPFHSIIPPQPPPRKLSISEQVKHHQPLGTVSEHTESRRRRLA
jgi:hypothetical protein